MRFAASQRDRTLVHPTLPQPPPTTTNNGEENGLVNHPTTQQQPQQQQQQQHTFVICADTQFGVTNLNRDWATEIEYSRQAIRAINALEPRPLYCCVCGDLGDMVPSIFQGSPKDPIKRKNDNGTEEEKETWTTQECETVQESQFQDFQSTWSEIHPDIALVCLCGNHDVGNRPNAASIQRFTSFFGDDYLAFWANGTYNIVLNSNLFSNPTDAMDLYEQQLTWLRERLEYARNEKNATHIFLYSHHPWFLHHEDEDEVTDLLGSSPAPVEWGPGDVPFFPISDGYFVIPKRYRTQIMEWCRDYKVTAAFAGHFHQNHVVTTSFGMPMIITSSLSVLLQSTSIPIVEPQTRGLRVVTVYHSSPDDDHDETEGNSSEEKKHETVVGAAEGGKFSHKFFSLEQLSKY